MLCFTFPLIHIYIYSLPNHEVKMEWYEGSPISIRWYYKIFKGSHYSNVDSIDIGSVKRSKKSFKNSKPKWGACECH